MTCAFIAHHKIDSYLKLQVLLRLRRNSPSSQSLVEIADQLFVHDLPKLERLLNDLRQQGVLCCDSQRWALPNHPDIAYCLGCLERTFNDPQARQRLLDQIAGRNAGYVS